MAEVSPKHILLLGAGFSRNWGGWLASEAFEYLLGDPEIDSSLRDLLWRHRRTGGFERALGELQDEHQRSPNAATRSRLQQMEDALSSMFTAMQVGFESVRFEFSENRDNYVASFLTRFDAIFTLNQDLLLERHYLLHGQLRNGYRRWNGFHIFGVRPQNTEMTDMIGAPWQKNTAIMVPGGHPTIQDGLQPYVKLHGSSNWRGANDARILVMGAHKRARIDHFSVLGNCYRVFEQYLSSGPVRIMVIGYSFGDDHINDTLLSAATTGRVKMFIIDTIGTDVIDKNRTATIYSPDRLISGLGPHVIGASRRTLREIFGSDHVEHAKVIRFFQEADYEVEHGRPNYHN